MIDKESVISIYAAVGPSGDIVKSSVGTFRAVASRFAQARRNYTVVKLAEISPSVRTRKSKIATVEIKPQQFDAVIEVSDTPLRRRRRTSAEMALVRKTANAE
jgi:hypothetical protein